MQGLETEYLAPGTTRQISEVKKNNTRRNNINGNNIEKIHKNSISDLFREPYVPYYQRPRGKRGSWPERPSPSPSAQRAAETAITLGIYPAPTASDYVEAKGHILSERGSGFSRKPIGISMTDYLEIVAKRIASQRMPSRIVPTANLLGLRTHSNSPNLLSFGPTEQGLKNREKELEGLFGGRRKTHKKLRRVYKK